MLPTINPRSLPRGPPRRGPSAAYPPPKPPASGHFASRGGAWPARGSSPTVCTETAPCLRTRPATRSLVRAPMRLIAGARKSAGAPLAVRVPLPLATQVCRPLAGPSHPRTQPTPGRARAPSAPTFFARPPPEQRQAPACIKRPKCGLCATHWAGRRGPADRALAARGSRGRCVGAHGTGTRHAGRARGGHSVGDCKRGLIGKKHQ